MAQINAKDAVKYRWLSTDIKETVGVIPLSKGVESDTGDTYEFDGDSWNKTGTAGAAHVTDTTYGDYPDRDYVDINGALIASASADLFVSTDISIFDAMAFEVTALTGTSPIIKAFPSFDGSLYSAIGLSFIDLRTNAAIDGTTGITGALIATSTNFMVAPPLKCRKIKLTYTVTGTGNCSIRGGVWKR